MHLQSTPATQKTLSAEQIEAFYHDEFVEDQVRDFVSLIGTERLDRGVVVDVGGGCGFFAKRLAVLTGCKVRVLDMDLVSVTACQRSGIEAIRADALDPPIAGDEVIVSFNLILHHLVGSSETTTLDLQHRALAAWRPHVRGVFVNEYIYESYLRNLSGWLIFQITKSPTLSWIGRTVSRVVPTLKANTFAVGVRFRSHEEWRRVFASAGYAVKSAAIGHEERVSAALRLLLISRIRRDSFLLEPAAIEPC